MKNENIERKDRFEAFSVVEERNAPSLSCQQNADKAFHEYLFLWMCLCLCVVAHGLGVAVYGCGCVRCAEDFPFFDMGLSIQTTPESGTQALAFEI